MSQIANDTEKSYASYDLKWRNTVVTKVHWPNSKEKDDQVEIFFKFVINEQLNIFTSSTSFKLDFEYDTTSDLEFIKMAMDRFFVEQARLKLHHLESGAGYIETKILRFTLEYVLDIFEHPYEWGVSY